jgi:hypothetical protein
MVEQLSPRFMTSLTAPWTQHRDAQQHESVIWRSAPRGNLALRVTDLPNDFDFFGGDEMGRTMCESCKSIDVRRWHREGRLRAGQWFSCSWTWGDEPSGSGRRVAKLYAAGELFACRRCYGLAYESQQEPIHQRGLGKAQKIRMQMGGSQNMFEPFPDKPKGMHWRTYDRRRGAHDVAEARFLKGSMRFIDRLGRAPRRAPR